MAEWCALVKALEWLNESGLKMPSRLKIEGDSQLIINQYTGEWKCNDSRMKMWCGWAIKAAEKTGCLITAFWIRREQNEWADSLSQRGIYAESDNS